MYVRPKRLPHRRVSGDSVCPQVCPAPEPSFYTFSYVPGPLSVRDVLTPGGLCFPPPPLKSFEKHWLESFIDFLELPKVLFIGTDLFRATRLSEPVSV